MALMRAALLSLLLALSLPLLLPLATAVHAETTVVTVALLELAADPSSTRLQRATAQLGAAAKQGADIALLPERWVHYHAPDA